MTGTKNRGKKPSPERDGWEGQTAGTGVIRGQSQRELEVRGFLPECFFGLYVSVLPGSPRGFPF